MTARLDPRQLGARIAARVSSTVADELRDARVARGISQAQLAASLGIGRYQISAAERNVASALTIDHLARHAAALGLKLSIRLYPLAEPIRDAAQVKYIGKFVARIGSSWRIGLDVPIPVPGDLRAIDVVLTGVCVVAVEVITRIRDIQAELRAAQLKQRDLGADRLILVVAGTNANRHAIREAQFALAPAFELDTRRVFAALAGGRDPGRDSIVVLE